MPRLFSGKSVRTSFVLAERSYDPGGQLIEPKPKGLKKAESLALIMPKESIKRNDSRRNILFSPYKSKDMQSASN